MSAKLCRTVFMFSGQGSQYPRMGYDLYARNASFRRHVDALDKTVVELTGISAAAAFLNAPRADLAHDSVVTGLSIYVVQRALTELLLENRVTPDCILSSSMGIFAAGVLGEAYEERQGISLVHDVMKAIDERCARGGLIAVLGSSAAYREEDFPPGATELVGVNFEIGFVLAALGERFADVIARLQARSLIVQALPVARPYHSRWIEPAKDAIVALGAASRATPALPIWCCSGTKPIDELDGEQAWRTVRSMMNLGATVAEIERRGPCTYLDVGPSGTLATILQRALPAESASTALPLLTPFRRDAEHLERTLSQLVSPADVARA